MSYSQVPQKDQPSPLRPLIGFIILVGGGGVSWFVAPAIRNWLTTAEVSIGSLGQIMPIAFPDNWPPIATQAIVAILLFGVLLTLMMIIMLSLSKTPRGELDIGLEEIREQKKKSKQRSRVSWRSG